MRDFRRLDRIVCATTRYQWQRLRQRIGRSKADPDVDAHYLRAFHELSNDLATAEGDSEKLARIFAEATQSVVMDPQTASAVLIALEADAPRMLHEHRRFNSRFEAHMTKRWGVALDRFYMVAVACEETGSDGYRSARSFDLAEDNAALLEALSGLHARACRTAFEVHHLLAAGFPMGAQARSRTIHELAVVSRVLIDASDKPGFENIGSRFLAFDSVVNALDVAEHQQYAGRLGEEPFTDEEIAAIHAARDEAISRFPNIDRRLGWAGDLPGLKRRTFEELEVIAGLDHLRPYYTWASHEVHATPKGVRLNRVRGPWGELKLTGRTNSGLADPAQTALIALNQATASFLACPGVTSPARLVAANAIRLLVDETCGAFAKAEIQLRQQAGER